MYILDDKTCRSVDLICIACLLLCVGLSKETPLLQYDNKWDGDAKYSATQTTPTREAYSHLLKIILAVAVLLPIASHLSPYAIHIRYGMYCFPYGDATRIHFMAH